MSSPALVEYRALKTVKEKLAFNCSGRPGAKEIKGDQERLLALKGELHRRFRNQINRDNLLAKKSDHMRLKDYMWRCENEAYHEKDEREGAPRSLLGLPINSECPKKIGTWFYHLHEHVDYDWNHYSKSWHKRYGAKKTLIRYVTFARFFRGKPKTIKVDVARLSGDWLHKAAKEAGILKPVKSKLPLRIRLKAEYDAKLDCIRRGYKIYSRTLLGTHIDWVIESPLGMIFHGTDRSQLISGLRKKIGAAANKLSFQASKKIDWEACKKLGFCDAGIHAFCDDFSLNPKSAYTPEEIKNAIRKAPHLATPYLDELHTLAKAFNTTYEL